MNQNMRYELNEITPELIKSAEAEVAALLRGATADLHKGLPPGPPEESALPSAEGSAEMPEDSAEGEAPGEPDGDEGGLPPGAEGGGGGGGDMVAQAHEWLAQMPPDQVMAVYQACQEIMGEQGGGAGQEASPPPPGMGKSERQPQERPLRKSALERRIELLEGALRRSQAPAARSAFTGRGAETPRLAKAEKGEVVYLDKADFNARLAKAAQRPDLTVQDRRDITNFYDTGDVNLVARLLETK